MLPSQSFQVIVGGLVLPACWELLGLAKVADFVNEVETQHPRTIPLMGETGPKQRARLNGVAEHCTQTLRKVSERFYHG